VGSNDAPGVQLLLGNAPGAPTFDLTRLFDDQEYVPLPSMMFVYDAESFVQV
jgi:hypothetical protein